MRRALFAGLFLAIVPPTALAQSAPYLGTVVDAEVLVRAGPSDKFPETGTLLKGSRVIVDHEEAGWLAIQAPAGSVSWVPIAFVDFNPSLPIPQNVVVSDDVTLAAGKVGLSQPLTEIRKAKAPAGTALTVIGQKATFDGKQWYPVQPIPGDFRYIPKSSVNANGPASTAFVVRDTAPANLPPALPASRNNGGSEGNPLGGSDKPPVNDPLWEQAQAAEKAGRNADAEKLYFQLARKMNEPGGDHDIANLCYTRIHALREKKAPGTSNGSSGTTKPQPSQRSDRPTLLPPVRNDASNPTAVSVATQPNPVSAAPATGEKPSWTGTGRLVSSALALDGRRTYAFEIAPGVAQFYVVGAQGFNLDQFKNRTVKVYGTTQTHRNASKPYIVASDVIEVKP
ncbi:MAG TPA: hypothetical protein VN641_08465 [Urbifossiella sp.]|nr:hypothetical protein [Urbifossiella sp.]